MFGASAGPGSNSFAGPSPVRLWSKATALAPCAASAPLASRATGREGERAASGWRGSNLFALGEASSHGLTFFFWGGVGIYEEEEHHDNVHAFDDANYYPTLGMLTFITMHSHYRQQS